MRSITASVYMPDEELTASTLRQSAGGLPTQGNDHMGPGAVGRICIDDVAPKRVIKAIPEGGHDVVHRRQDEARLLAALRID